MKIIRTLLLGVSLCSGSLWAASTNQPFERGSLTVEQQQAWQYYVNSESAAFGCEYGDDFRLSEDPGQLFRQLQAKAEMPPVQITYRTLLSAGPQTRTLLANNLRIASMHCNSVYWYEGELIGLPVLPFEEALTLLHDDLANYGQPERILRLTSTFRVAGMDPRWFWTFFVADRAHLDMIGLDYDTLVHLEQILWERDTSRDFSDDSYNLLHQIFLRLNNFSLKFYANSGECEKTQAEPPASLMIWPEITDGIVRELYTLYGIDYRGRRSASIKKAEGGYTLYQEKPIDNPDIPLFNVRRGLTINSVECDG